MSKVLSKKDEKKRDLILNGNMWQVVIYIAGPLALYQWLNQFFKVFDSMIAANISPMSVSAVAYLSQVSSMVSGLGTGIAVGSCIKISEAYGAGDFDLVHKRLNTLFKLCALVGVFIAILIPFSAPLLALLNTPTDFIVEGAIYFSIILFDDIILIFNTAYISIERVRGNSGRILKYNLCATILKLTLSCIFVFVFNQGIAMIAVATVISDMIIFSAFIRNLCLNNKGDIFSISEYNLKVDKVYSKPLINISAPVVGDRVSLQLGKVVVSSMASKYGSLVVGALGISNNINSMIVSIQTGFKDGGAAILSQNIGAGNKRRSIDAFYKLMIVNIVIAIVGVAIARANLGAISAFFSSGDEEFALLIQEIFMWEAYATILQGAYAAVTALLYGYGYTKMTMFLNIARLFVFRIPVLWFLQNMTNIGSVSVGIVMAVSNGSVGIIGIIVSIFVIRKIKREIALEEAQEILDN